jgi:hypothetical protein
VHQQTKRTDRKKEKSNCFPPVRNILFPFLLVRKTLKKNFPPPHCVNIKEKKKELLLPLGRQFFFLNVPLRFAIHPVRQT